MSDKIKVSTDQLDQLASKLKSLGNKLGTASNTLGGIHMDSTTADHDLRQGSCSLSGNAGVYRISAGSTRATVRRYSNVLDEYDDLCQQMARNVNAVKERFLAVEAELSAIANGDAEDIGNILGFPKDTGKWSDKQWNKYLEFSTGYVPYTVPTIGTVYIKDGHIIVLDDDNRKSEYDLGDFLFHNSPFKVDGNGCFPKPSVIRPFISTITAVVGGIKESAENGGFWSKWEVDKGSSIELFKGKNDDNMSGLLKNSKGENVKELTKSKKKGDKGKMQESDEGVLKPKHTFAEIGVKNSDYGGLLMAEGGISGENGHIKGKAAVGYGEYSMGAYAGLYGYDKDGKLVLSPGVRAEIGGSVSVLHADFDAAYDFGDVEVGASASVDVGKVGAKAEGQLGWVDGKFAANAGFEAEALLFEAKGSVSAGNDYVGVKATGSVQVGVGVSADVGYHDGVISLELGAALGVGLSGKVELDISGTIDAVTGAAESVYEGAKEVAKNVQKAAKQVEKTVQNVQKAAQTAAKTAQKTVQKAAQNVTKNVQNAAKTAQKTVKNAQKAVKNAASNAAKNVSKGLKKFGSLLFGG